MSKREKKSGFFNPESENACFLHLSEDTQKVEQMGPNILITSSLTQFKSSFTLKNIGYRYMYN